MQPQRQQNNGILDETARAHQQLADLREEFREFVYRVSHDVNAPMRSVINFSELFSKKYENSLLDNQAHDYLTYITKGVTQAQDMLSALLEYSRINTFSNPPAEVDCNLVLERCLRHLRPGIDQCEAIIKSDPLPTVSAETRQLEKLFGVLIENALSFRSPQRPPEITVSVKSAEDAWLFSITDNGIGIAPKHHLEIFQMFRHVHADIEHPGLGVGLALAHKIVRHHRGEIWVASEPDKGATFYFTLPADSHVTEEGLP